MDYPHTSGDESSGVCCSAAIPHDAPDTAMRFRRPNLRSLRDLFCTVVAVAFISILITYQLGRYLPRQHSATEVEIHFKGRVDIYRNSRSIGGATISGGGGGGGGGDDAVAAGVRAAAGIGRLAIVGDKRKGLEGIDLEEGWPGRQPRAPKENDQTRKKNVGETSSKKSTGDAEGERPRRRTLKPDLLRKLRKVERDSLEDGSQPRVAVIRRPVSVKTDCSRLLSLYEHALKRAGYHTKTAQGYVVYTSGDNSSSVMLDAQPGRNGYVRQLWDTGWGLYLCLGSGVARDPPDTAGGPEPVPDPPCMESDVYHKLQPYQKVNHIPALDSIFGSREDTCATLAAIQYIPGLEESQFSPPCFHLPEQYEDFLGAADAQGHGTKWVVKVEDARFPRVQLMDPHLEKDFLKIKNISTKRALVQQYVAHPLLLFGMPFSVTAYVIITSWQPLRAYIHSEGVVHFRHDYQRNFEKVPGRTWTFDKWRHQLAQIYSEAVADVAFRNMETVVTQTLLVSEFIQLTNHERWAQPVAQSRVESTRCSNCFQLLSFDLIYNSSFHPVITEINLSPGLEDTVKFDNWENDTSRSRIVDDVIAMVSATTLTATDVAIALGELNINIDTSAGTHRCRGFQSERSCLYPGDLQYLVSLRRETLHLGGFKQLYPSKESDRYSSLLRTLHKYSRYFRKPITRDQAPSASDRQPGSHPGGDGYNTCHDTAQMHPLVLPLIRYFHSQDVMEGSYDDLNLPLFGESKTDAKADNKLVENIFYNSSGLDDKYVRQTCSDDRSIMSGLDGIFSEPSLELSPSLNATIGDYYATVPYEVFLIKIWAFATSCFCEARLEEKYGLSRPSNFTLGLGNNKIVILVVDVTHTEPWIINTYTLYIHREDLSERSQSDNVGSPRPKVCRLPQDCELQIQPSLPCGLQLTKYLGWGDFQQHVGTLRDCTSGDAPGEWFVPCDDCTDRRSCDWQMASWQPLSCRHPRMPREELKQCLAGKQILFIGDSTNRGIMHYLMEQANGSLSEWDKTHDVKVYTNLNEDRTSVSFAYYPQFWLPVSQRPVFDKAIYQLMKQAQPLENNHNTVLVVGGVHWLATHHISVIAKALQREGLGDIRVIIKSLGAGFHQPVNGLHCLTQREQRKLVIHNAGLLDFAKRQGFDVVATFNMTMARYKDFLEGKCACHFHRVREVLPSFTQYMQSTGVRGVKLVDMPIYYHVEGDINAAYSEIMLNRICAKT